jgi:PAS domain S-box-containing protein
LEDISVRITGEAALQKEINLRRAIEESIPSGIAAIGPDGKQTYVNRAFAEMVGWSPDELVGASAPFAYWPDEQVESIQQALAATLQGSAPRLGFELRFRRRKGEEFDALATIAALSGEAGDTSGWVASISDITEQKKAARDLARSEARLAMALEAVSMGAWEWDVKTGAVCWSPQLEAIHGIPPGRFRGTFEDFQADMNPEHRPRVLAAIEEAVNNRTAYQVEYEIVRPDATRTWVEARGRVLCDKAGNPERMIGVCMDIASRKAQAA